jgi:hypothetical protein
VVHGTARLTEGGGPELLHDLAQVYIGPGATFPPMPNPPAGHIMRVTVTKVGGCELDGNIRRPVVAAFRE